MKWIAAILLVCSPATPAFGQLVNRETEKGIIRVAAVGETVWEKARFKGAPGVRISGPVQQAFAFGQTVSLSADSTLMVIRPSKLKACELRVVYRLGGVSSGGWLNCLIDKDDDGRFEAVAVNELSGARPINPPVLYSKEMVPVEGVGEGSFKQLIVYLGKSGSDIRLSYREFANDMARPAFTEELTIPAPTEYPQNVRVKSLLVEVTGIDGEGLHYRLK